MRSTRLRLTLFFGIATLVFAVLGTGIVGAQAYKVVDLKSDQHPDNTGKFAPLDWDPSQGTHPGQTVYENTCKVCHSLGSERGAGPGLRGLEDRVPSRKRLFEFILDPKGTDDDEYFSALRKDFGDAMMPRGGNAKLTDQDILNVIDFILRHDVEDFSEADYNKKVALGSDLVSGRRGFKWGGPSCIGCHSVGPDKDLMGSGIGPNIGHTYVLAKQLGSDDKRNYADGLYQLLSAEDAPAMHYWYRDIEGSHPLTDEELDAVVTYFESVARETGTEKDSNYLPILALLFAALGILILEPGVVNLLFAKEDHEYIDGPYEPEEHHEEEQEEEKPEEKADEKSAEKPEEKEEAESEDSAKAEDKPDEPEDEKAEESEEEKSDDDSDDSEEEKKEAPEEESDDDESEEEDSEDDSEDEGDSEEDSDEDSDDEEESDEEESEGEDESDDEPDDEKDKD